MPSDSNDWAVLDELLGIDVADAEIDASKTFAFYGRVSTEDNQDPETSYGWQFGNAQKFAAPGLITQTYFDVGQSRSVPWDRRPEASRLLADLKRPDRGWSAIVVGEGTRCWFGNQFSLIAPRIHAYDVEVWVPELGGMYNARNATHTMMMSMLGGLSESERQHVQQRTRASMDAQVLNEGRHQGGRAPYGYVVVDGPPHPNPNRAADGLCLRILSVDVEAAPVVQRIFREYIAGQGDKAIATRLNRDGIPCPSAHRPGQNRHRSGDGWQASTVAAILQNPRYTGYAVFGRWAKKEELIDPDDVAAGYAIRFVRSTADRVIRSKKPAHPAIVSVETFTEAHLIRRSRAGASSRDRARNTRSRTTTRPYLLRGPITCDICGRKMQAGVIRGGVYYRCHSKTLAPGSPISAEHPRTVNLREMTLADPLNRWLADLFGKQQRAQTLEFLLEAHNADDSDMRRNIIKARIAEANQKLERYTRAIEAGIDPSSLVAAMNAAQAERAAAQVELDTIPRPVQVTVRELSGIIDSHGDIRARLDAGDPMDKMELYKALEVQIRYQPIQRRAQVSAGFAVVSTGVRRGTHALTTEIDLRKR
ncbi:recombinase family protein [Nocardia rhamnosiphila]|uniref:recombinase family protein n=1 Tax=Nocardia rhamnosiphila TaxID=426716 RepID=UPI0033C53CCF